MGYQPVGTGISLASPTQRLLNRRARRSNLTKRRSHLSTNACKNAKRHNPTIQDNAMDHGPRASSRSHTSSTLKRSQLRLNATNDVGSGVPERTIIRGGFRVFPAGRSPAPNASGNAHDPASPSDKATPGWHRTRVQTAGRSGTRSYSRSWRMSSSASTFEHMSRKIAANAVGTPDKERWWRSGVRGRT